MNIPKKKCEVCAENDMKYKCPKCLIIYCSLNCFKTHKERCVNIEIEKKDEEETKSELTNTELKQEGLSKTEQTSSIQYKFPVQIPVTDDLNSVEADFVPKEKLKLLGESEELKAILSNKHLREILENLNKHDENIDQKIQQAMQEPLFQEFSDACLKIVQEKSDLHL